MKVRRKLVIYGDSAALGLLAVRVTASLADGWSRSAEYEQHRLAPYCFLCGSHSTYSPFVVLLDRDGNHLEVTNITAAECAFSMNGYNAVLADFFLRFLEPAGLDLLIKFELSSGELSIKEIIGRRGAQLLKNFSFIANRSPAHAADRRRWLQFAAHLRLYRRGQYDIGLIRRWLLDEGWSDEGWSIDQAGTLIEKLHFAEELLEIYDNGCASG